MLCRLGIGIAPIAKDLASVLRRLAGADAAAVFWLDAAGMPEGFFHEDAPPHVQDLFLNEFERLFVGANETNVYALAQGRGPRVGRLIAPDSDYFRSNTYNLLIRGCGHHHTLDLRVDVKGRARAVVLLFRGPGTGFGEGAIACLERASRYLERAIDHALAPAAWQGNAGRTGHLVVESDHGKVLMFDENATAILRDANRRGLGLHARTRLDRVPDFLIELCRRVRSGGTHASPDVAVPVPGGTLLAHARPLVPTGETCVHAPAQALVELREVRPSRLEVIHRVLALKLTPLQREIALLAGLGHARADCPRVIGVSAEALKKHLRVVYAAAGANDWGGLARALEA